jgi:pyrroline-5-carboxylate reductase
MLMDKKICILGTGNMGQALVSGLVGSGSSKPQDIVCTDVREVKLKAIEKQYGVQISTSNLEAVSQADIIIYAVKPQIMATVLNETSEKLDMSQ